MKRSDVISEKTIEELYRVYDSPGGISCVEEFYDDAYRISFVVKLLLRYSREKDTNLRLLVNHVVILENVFGEFAFTAIREYIEKYEGLSLYFNSVLMYMGRLGRDVMFDVQFYETIKRELG